MTAQALGLIVPPANPTVEPEFRQMVPTSVNLYAARLPVVSGDLQARLAHYDSVLTDVAATLDGLSLGALVAACTGCSYRSTPDADSQAADDMSDRLGGVAAITAASAVRAVLDALEVQTITMLSPYPDWLTAQSAAYWTACGFRVAGVHKVPGSGKIYDLSDTDIAAALDQAIGTLDADTSGHAVVITGTGARSLTALDQAVSANSVPLLSSNLASAWWALNALGGSELVAASPSAALARLDEHIRSVE